MSKDCVTTEYPAAGVRRILLNRPERLNAINPALLEALIAALRAADEAADVRAIILAGAGRAFCAGDDLKEFDDQVGSKSDTLAYIERIQDVTRAIVLGDTPVIAAVHGWAVGGGLEWMINCDFALAANGSRFFFPEIRWGLFVTGAVTQLLPRLVGLQKARELIMLGEEFDATQARDWGLIREAVAAEALEDKALELAQRIAALPPGPVRALKRILARHSLDSLETAMAAEAEATLSGFLDPATAQRIRAF